MTTWRTEGNASEKGAVGGWGQALTLSSSSYNTNQTPRNLETGRKAVSFVTGRSETAKRADSRSAVGFDGSSERIASLFSVLVAVFLILVVVPRVPLADAPRSTLARPGERCSNRAGELPKTVARSEAVAVLAPAPEIANRQLQSTWRDHVSG